MRKTWLLALAWCVMAVLATLFQTSVAYASDDESPQILDYRPSANPVADRTVHLNVNKLDSSSHEYVPGAKLQIVDKETKEVMIEWTSGTKAASIDRELDVDRTYILREVSAPEGYEKAKDVEFVLRSVNFETKGEVVSGEKTDDGETNAEFNNVSGDIETQAFVISLYDAQEMVEHTETRTETRPNTRTKTNETHTTNNETTRRTQANSDSIEYQEEEIVQDEVTPDSRTTSSRRVIEESNEDELRTVPQDDQEVRTVTNERVTYQGDTYQGDTYVETSTTPIASSDGATRDYRGGGTLTQTGDSTTFAPIIVVAVIGVAAVVGALLLRRKN